MQLIRNTRQLRQALAQGQNEFRLALQAGLYSRKTVMLLPDGRFEVVNHIDDTTQRLSGRQLYSQSNTGKAMKLGAFAVSD